MAHYISALAHSDLMSNAPSSGYTYILTGYAQSYTQVLPAIYLVLEDPGDSTRPGLGSSPLPASRRFGVERERSRLSVIKNKNLQFSRNEGRRFGLWLGCRS